MRAMKFGREDADRAVEELTAPMRDVVLSAPADSEPSPNLLAQLEAMGIVGIGGSGRWRLTAFGQLVRRRLELKSEE